MIKGFKQMLFFSKCYFKKRILKGSWYEKKIIFGCIFRGNFSLLQAVAHDCHGWVGLEVNERDPGGEKSVRNTNVFSVMCANLSESVFNVI